MEEKCAESEAAALFRSNKHKKRKEEKHLEASDLRVNSDPTSYLTAAQ